MTAFLIVLACWLLPAALAVAWVSADMWMARREEALRREQQNRVASPEWLAVLAATEPTPVYDQLMCEQIERMENWS